MIFCLFSKGMFIGGDYVFSWWNFIGLNISAIATIMYTKITFGRNSKSAPAEKGIQNNTSIVRESKDSNEVSGVNVRHKRTDNKEETATLLSNTNSS